MSAALAPLKLQYADFALWQQLHTLDDESAILEWWHSKLDGAPQLLELPVDHARVPQDVVTGSAIGTQIDAQTGLAMISLCQEEHVSTLCGLLASLQRVVGGPSWVPRWPLDT